MKIRNLIFPVLFCFAVFPGCRNNEEKNTERSSDLLTIKTLGLAYLEEFKLEEAEQEFLKFIELEPKDKFGYANLGLTYLRMAKYPEAEIQLGKAIKRDKKDPDIRLILATVYKMDNKPELAVSELKKAISFAPDHIKCLYEITEIYSSLPDEEALRQRTDYLKKLVEVAPHNLVPRLNLTGILINDGDYDKATEQLEIIKKQFPEFPAEAVDYYDKTLKLLRTGVKDEALIQFTIFHNYLKVTSPYQAGILELKGPGGSLIGFPVITFNRQLSAQVKSGNISLLDFLKFTDISSLSGLEIIQGFNQGDHPEFRYSTHAEACDYDGDGDIDIYAGSFDPGTSSYRHYLFRNDLGILKDITVEAGLLHSGKEASAAFADYDNDGYTDLFIMKEGGDILYRNTGKGTFEDVTARAGAGSRTGGKKAIFFDMDHDGDLDLFEILSGSGLLLRNNSDGTFTDQSARLTANGNKISHTGAVFSDFDEDEDIDFVIVNSDADAILYSNQRQGVFKNTEDVNGLSATKGAGAVASGDYNNDGYPDLFIGSETGGSNYLLRNRRDGTFERDEKAGDVITSLSGVRIYDAAFLDFNNDGFLDLLLTGEPVGNTGRGIFLYYNNGSGNFSDVSRLIPSDVKSGRQISVSDFDRDGDLDLIISGLNGKIHLLRNDGGNSNSFISMKLVGLRAGSAKNNHFGIGAKIEIRAGDLYESMIVTDQNVHFGLGSHARADIIRIRWTNGVPQNIFLPGSNQSLIEEQTLKGSCPFLYAWNGEEFTFVKDILWRSALGMPTGIMGGTTSYAFADPSDDYLKIPGEIIRPENGRYSLRITSELWETIYLDKLELVAVDHPDSTEIFVPEQFSPPPFPGLKIIKARGKRLPVSAVDSEGVSVLPYISEDDDVYLSDFIQGKYQGITEMRDLIIDPGPVDPRRNLFMFLNGWIFPTDASINVALSQSESLKVTPPLIQVINREGEWETVIMNLGFPMGKDKTCVTELTGIFLSDDHRIRIRTNMEIYWDQIFFSEEVPGSPAVLTVLSPADADLHYRGFSKPFRKGSRYGPHWFDYSVVETGQKWRDLTGNYTRYGDVLPLLTEADNKYIISNAGDETTVIFDESSLPELQKGWKRDFLIRSVGWVKDGDLNTAYGNTVLPLPFTGMKSYPPSDDDIYPADEDLQKYNREYNTRKVTAGDYINALK